MSRPRVVQFYATKSDLEPGLRAIDSAQRLTLAEDRVYENSNVPTLRSLAEIPDLGKVQGRRSSRFLVLRESERVNPARVVQTGKKSKVPRGVATALALIGICPPGGKVTFEIRQSDHPSSIVFAAGGLANPQLLIAGEIATMHETAASRELHGLFCKELLRGFTKVKSFDVGPEAMVLLKSGGRLTIDAKARDILDLMAD